MTISIIRIIPFDKRNCITGAYNSIVTQILARVGGYYSTLVVGEDANLSIIVYVHE